ncbi:MAG: proteobacterial dedicated sortase system histidine kinase [Gammaproteobacteria bacterium]|nr:proteobacterial dedicated sortase system histidine kinase [Gammaproteobacteria bacterium]
MGSSHPYSSIRFKLLLVSLSLLTLPWAGYQFIQQTEQFLRQSQADALLTTARASAAMLGTREALFEQQGLPDDTDPGSAIYLHPLSQPIQLDGYSDDWPPWPEARQHYQGADGLSLALLAGTRGRHLYLLLDVTDDHLVYQQPMGGSNHPGDRIQITLQQYDGERFRFELSSISPGWVEAEPIEGTPGYLGGTIRGEWQPTEQGYRVELRIPRRLVDQRMGVQVIDVDDPVRRAIKNRIGSARMDTGPLISPNPELAGIVEGIRTSGTRLWVLNRNARVLARSGSLQQSERDSEGISPSLLDSLLSRILARPHSSFSDPHLGRSRLQGEAIESALLGKPHTQRRATTDGRAVILSATWPIRSQDGIIGTVLVEETTNRILSLQSSALENLLKTSFIAFSITALVLLGFATHLVRRIRRLRDHVEAAVTEDGRIKGALVAEQSLDEIGDLSRNFSAVLNRLAEYNRYLEAMASRLAHEMRTPLAVVKSSLELIDTGLTSDEQQKVLKRAREGSERLGLILHRMREATRLEQMLQEAEVERFDLTALIDSAVDGFRSAFPDVSFEKVTPDQPAWIKGVPDLLFQALDKLVSNAVDFHTPHSPIQITLDKDGGSLRLCVANQGPSLPTGMEDALFDSMVSIRQVRQTEPHLGLGLYLVKMITEFQDGTVSARNNREGTGVIFCLIFNPD